MENALQIPLEIQIYKLLTSSAQTGLCLEFGKNSDCFIWHEIKRVGEKRFVVFFGGHLFDALVSGVFAIAICFLSDILSPKIPNKVFYYFITSFSVTIISNEISHSS